MIPTATQKEMIIIGRNTTDLDKSRKLGVTKKGDERRIVQRE